MLLSEVWRLYHADKRLRGYSPVTLKGYALQHRLMVVGVGNKELQDITLEDLKEYLAAQEHLKPASIAHRVRFIRSFFRWIMEEGLLDKNPAIRLIEPKLGKRVPKALSEEEVETLRTGCETAQEHTILELLYSTGCRIGELVTINRNMILWDSRSIIVLGKGDQEREVYFSVKASIWLKKYLAERTDKKEALFVTNRQPIQRMSIDMLRYILKRIAKRAGVDANVYPHRLRHSYATHLLNNGAPLELIQTLLGHSKSETTQIYAHMCGDLRRDLYRKHATF